MASSIKRDKLSYQFKVTLKEIEPPIWRRIVVPATYNFWELHVAIQDAMGWLDCHLHAFRLRNPDTDTIEEIGIPDDAPFEDDRPCLPGWEVPIAAYFRNPGDRSDYTYDFGDGWEHDLLPEEIVARQPRKKNPRCLDGARACPRRTAGEFGDMKTF